MQFLNLVIKVDSFFVMANINNLYIVELVIKNRILAVMLDIT